MSPQRAEFSRRAVRWLLPASLVALAPKCVLCVAAYAGAGAALAVAGPEICGASAGTPGAWTTMLAWLGAVGTAGAAGCSAACGHNRWRVFSHEEHHE